MEKKLKQRVFKKIYITIILDQEHIKKLNRLQVKSTSPTSVLKLLCIITLTTEKLGCFLKCIYIYNIFISFDMEKTSECVSVCVYCFVGCPIETVCKRKGCLWVL